MNSTPKRSPLTMKLAPWPLAFMLVACASSKKDPVFQNGPSEVRKIEKARAKNIKSRCKEQSFVEDDHQEQNSGQFPKLCSLGKIDWGWSTASRNYHPRQRKLTQSVEFERSRHIIRLMQDFPSTVAESQYAAKTQTLTVLLYKDQVLPRELQCILQSDWPNIKLEPRKTCYSRATYEHVSEVINNGTWAKKKFKHVMSVSMKPFRIGAYEVTIHPEDQENIAGLRKALGPLFDALVHIELTSSL